MELGVQQKFATYPPEVAVLLHNLRDLIFTVAEQQKITDISETLKWGEPSYLCKSGSTIRFDWKAKNPAEYCLYFNCKTRLVDTFKELYGNTFTYAGNRAIVLTIGQPIPSKELAHCLSLALGYKKFKHLHLLGA
ncbi:DUF1801 domain-containing protein [Paraglaciecola sp. L3A3]|uniref:DUF1801 domain-containing protein n=1 Tax=Paraglaciecola sp. L3A3 TaxID=2686358 RepID=UPI00131A75EB|nr:DUF1801 domain-containing protein [Paraglaciecola sp. L3A3]